MGVRLRGRGGAIDLRRHQRNHEGDHRTPYGIGFAEIIDGSESSCSSLNSGRQSRIALHRKPMRHSLHSFAKPVALESVVWIQKNDPRGIGPEDVYPHEKDGRVITIYEFLTGAAQ